MASVQAGNVALFAATVASVTRSEKIDHSQQNLALGINIYSLPINSW